MYYALKNKIIISEDTNLTKNVSRKQINLLTNKVPQVCLRLPYVACELLPERLTPIICPAECSVDA